MIKIKTISYCIIPNIPTTINNPLIKLPKAIFRISINCNKKLVQVSGLRFCATNRLPDESSIDLQSYVGFKKYLKNSKVPYKDGYTCLQVECRLCNRQNKSKVAYVNKKTGCFMCPECEIQYPLNEVVSVYEKGNTIEMQEVVYESRFPKQTEVPEDICSSLAVRELKTKDLNTIGTSYEPNLNLLCFPLKNAALKVVGEKTLHLFDKIEETYQKSSSGLLVCGPTNKNKAILVNNLLDYVSLLSLQIESHCIVCLPYALKSVPQECLPALEKFKELVFWFNFDSAGWDSATTFASKMDEKRCLLIRPTNTEPSPYEALRKKLNLRHILQRAMPVRHKSITTFSALRNDVLSELQNIEKVNGVKWKRFPILNKLLKGHRKGELTIITGPTGSGKTTFISEYSLDLALQGVSTLWGSFEIRNSRLALTLLRQFVGYSLETKLNEFDYWATQFEKHPLYFMTFLGQQPIKVVMEAIQHAQYVHDINHVIIDNLQFMMGISTSARNDKFWEQDAIIAAFRSFATKHNVHVTLVMHPRKERQEDDLTTSSVFGTAKATQEADNVLIIQDKRLTSLRGKKYLQIVKNRYSGDLGIMPLEFDKESLSYSASRKKKEKDKENNPT